MPSKAHKATINGPGPSLERMIGRLGRVARSIRNLEARMEEFSAWLPSEKKQQVRAKLEAFRSEQRELSEGLAAAKAAIDKAESTL